MKELTEREAINRINNKLKEYEGKYSFISFENNWKGTKKTKIILMCNIHKLTTSIGYKTFIKNGWKGCKICVSERAKLSKNRFRITKEIAENRILNKYGNDFYIKYIVPDHFCPDNQEIMGVCPKHGIFKTTLEVVLRKNSKGGCRKCYEERKILSKDKAIENINISILEKLEHGYNISFYGFVNNEWIGTETKLILHCNIHNNTWNTTSYNGFINNNYVGCIFCKKEKRSNDSSLSPEEATFLAKKFNKNNVDFSKIKNTYSSYNDYVTITCPIHGDYNIKYSTLMISPFSGKCPLCSGYSGEILCYNELLNYINSEYIHRQFELRNEFDYLLNTIRKIIYLDFYIEYKNQIIIIEFDGNQHTDFIKYFHKSYQDYVNQVNRDNFVEEYCKEQGWLLLRIPWVDIQRIPEILRVFFEEGRDITTKVEPKLLPIPYGKDIISRS